MNATNMSLKLAENIYRQKTAMLGQISNWILTTTTIITKFIEV